MSRRSATPRATTGSRGRVVAIALVIVVVILGAAGAVAWNALYKPAVKVQADKPVQVEVPGGASTARIASIMAEKGVVDNALMFRLKTRSAEADGQLRAGVYDLVTGMSYDAVIAELKKGPAIKYTTVTIPEGFVISQIAERLSKQAGIPKKEFVKLARGGAEEFAADHPYLKGAYEGSLEGYLFPKTYRFKEGTTAREAIEMMLDQFDREMATVDTGSATAQGFSVPEIVVMASIIEKEARLADERPLVSSVIYNRLERDMKLEICATVEYILPGNRFRLTWRETRTPSPYNTYLHKGLPPGPISNPGLASINAAVAPADTDYLYYVLTGKDGSQTYAATAQEFEKAKRKSKEVFGQ